MKKIIKITEYFFVLMLFSLFVFPKGVDAYIDAGSGSYLTQILIGIIFGSLFAFKNFWSKIRSTFFRGYSETKKTRVHVKNK